MGCHGNENVPLFDSFTKYSKDYLTNTLSPLLLFTFSQMYNRDTSGSSDFSMDGEEDY